MNSLIPDAMAQAAGGAPAGPGGVPFIAMMALMFVAMYFLIIRPQQKKQREHDEMLKTIQKGDRIVTNGGLHGVVVGTSDELLTVDLGVHEKVRVKLERRGVERRLEKGKGEETA